MKKLFITLSSFFIFNILFAQNAIIQWSKSYGGTKYDILNDITMISDSGFVFTGITQSTDGDVSKNDSLITPAFGDIWVVRLNRFGNIEWEKAIGGTGFDSGNGIMQTNDNGFIIIGATNSNDYVEFGLHLDTSEQKYDQLDFLVIKLDQNGNILWQKCYGGFKQDVGFNIIQKPSGGYIVYGVSKSDDGDVSGHHYTQNPVPPYYAEEFDFWILSIDENGNIVWQKSIGGSGEDKVYQILQSNNGDLYCVGRTASNDGDVQSNHIDSNGIYLSDAWVLKLDSFGNILWSTLVGGSCMDDFYGMIINNGKIVVVGSTCSTNGDFDHKIDSTLGRYLTSDGFIAVVDLDGKLLNIKKYGGISHDEWLQSIIPDNTGYLLLGTSGSFDSTGKSLYNAIYPDYWLLQIDQELNIVSNRVFGGSQPDYGHELFPLENGNILLAGSAQSSDRNIKDHHDYPYTGVYHENPDIWLAEITIPHVGIYEEEVSKQIILYPMPVSNTLNLSHSLQTDFDFSIYDLTGKELISGLGAQHEISINVENLNSGVYYLKLNFNLLGSKFFKIIISR